MNKKNIRYVILFCIGLFYSSISITAQSINKFSVLQTVDYGIKNATQVKNALIDVQIQKQTNREFTAIAYPQVAGSFQLNDFIDIPTSLLPGEIIGQPGTRVPIQFGTKYNATGSLDVSQVLFDGQVFIGLKARNTLLDYAGKNVEITQEQIKANIYKIYYQLVVGKKQLGAIDANIERFEKLLHDVKEIYKNGFAEKLDIDKVQVQLNNLITEKQKIENLLQTGNAGLKFLINMPQKDELILTDSITEEVIKQNILDSNYDYNSRKEMQLLTIAQKLQWFNVKRYQLSRLPSLVGFASYQKNAQRGTFDLFAKGDWFTTSLVGIKLNVPIFDGNARRAKLEKAKLDLKKTENTVEQFKASVDYEVNNARLKMKSAILTIDVQKQNMALAEKVYQTTKKKFEQGLGNNQEIYNAQAELKVAQTNYYSALYDAIIAKIDYLKAAGKL